VGCGELLLEFGDTELEFGFGEGHDNEVRLKCTVEGVHNKKPLPGEPRGAG
jgi:hypothetical protein